MASLEKFVTELNVTRFLAQLEAEADPVQRQLWTNLLIAEIGRSGSPAEQLELSEQCLQSCAQRLCDHRSRIKPGGAQAGLDLSGLLEIEKSLSAFAERLRQGMRAPWAV